MLHPLVNCLQCFAVPRIKCNGGINLVCGIIYQDVIVDENTPTNVFKRLDRAIQELDGFDKASMQQYIHNNVALLADTNILYPNGDILWSDKFGYVQLKRIKPNMAVPLTMAYGYNKSRKEYCPDFLFLYDSQRLLQVKSSIKWRYKIVKKTKYERKKR